MKASVGGKLAQVGSRLVDGAMRKMADDFFAAFSERLAPSVSADEADEAGDGEANRQDNSGQWKMWAVAALVVAIALALTLSN